MGRLAISQNVKLNNMSQHESLGAICFFADESMVLDPSGTIVLVVQWICRVSETLCYEGI